MDNISITELPIDFINENLPEQTKFSLQIKYIIKERVKNKKENETISDICRELHQDGIFVGDDTKTVLQPQTIRHYYYKFKKNE